MTKTKKTGTILLIILVLIIVIGGNTTLIETHEQTHRQIYAKYGIQSETEYGIRLEENEIKLGRTVAKTGYKKEDRQFVEGLQAMNEIVGYQMIAIYNLLNATIITTLALFIFIQVQK